MKDLMKKYTRAFSVSGREASLAAQIAEDLRPFADSVSTDAMGNLIVLKKGKDGGKKLMLAAHMDEIGFIATFIEDIGARSKKEAERKVKVGDCLAVAPELTKLGASRYAAKAFDDRLACALLAEVARTCAEPACDTYFVFTVQEEVGTRGGQVTAQRIQPDIGVAVDVTPCHDRPGDLEGSNALDHGVAIKISDTGSISDEGLVNKSIALCKEHNVPYQKDVIYVGGTDAGAMTLVGGGIKTIGFSVVTRYTHGPNAIVSQKDIEATVKMLELFMNADFE